jgi:hypothetical protein
MLKFLKRFLTVLLIFFFISFIFLSPILATRGCCSWHGGVAYCDTSTGRYVCNDGTYSPSCTCTYIPPCYTPTEVTTIDYNIKPTNSNCSKYTVSVEWEYLWDCDGFSITLNKYTKSDPGPYADTPETKYSFKNIIPGTYYLHIKAINSCGASDIYNEKIVVNRKSPELDVNKKVNEENVTISYNTTCVDSLLLNNGSEKEDLKELEDTLTVKRDEIDKEYVFTAKQGDKEVIKKVSIPKLIEEQDIEDEEIQLESPEDKDDPFVVIISIIIIFIIFGGVPAVIVYAIVRTLKKRKNKR